MDIIIWFQMISLHLETILSQVTQQVDQVLAPKIKANLMVASGILSELRLEDEVIYLILRRDIMNLPYRELFVKGFFPIKNSTLI